MPTPLEQQVLDALRAREYPTLCKHLREDTGLAPLTMTGVLQRLRKKGLIDCVKSTAPRGWDGFGCNLYFIREDHTA